MSTAPPGFAASLVMRYRLKLEQLSRILAASRVSQMVRRTLCLASAASPVGDST